MGPVVAARSLRAAVFGIEEVEESAKLAFLLRKEDVEFIPANYRQSLLKWGEVAWIAENSFTAQAWFPLPHCSVCRRVRLRNGPRGG